MAQPSIAAALPPETAVPQAGARVDSRGFYVVMAWVCAAIAFGGFIPTYWSPVVRGAFPGPPLMHVHGLLSFAWMVLFIVQARSAASGRFEHHRALGYLGIALAGAMVAVGMGAVVLSLRVGAALGNDAVVRPFAIVPFTVLLTFAVLFTLAIANVRRPETHLRLMLVTAISMLLPALGRVYFLLFAPPGAAIGLGHAPPVAVTLGPGIASDLLLVAAMVRDWRVLGRPHRVYRIALPCLLAVQIARVPLAHTAAWGVVADWLMRLGG